MGDKLHPKCLFRTVLVLLPCVAVQAIGCGDYRAASPEPVKIRIALKAPNSKVQAACWTFGSDGPVGTYQREQAEKAGAECYELWVLPGDLLAVDPANGDRDNGERSGPFLYVYQGDEAQPLNFIAQEYVGYSNGPPVYLDMTATEAREWLRQ